MIRKGILKENLPQKGGLTLPNILVNGVLISTATKKGLGQPNVLKSGVLKFGPMMKGGQGGQGSYRT